MSRTEHHIGKIKEVPVPEGMTLEEHIGRLLMDNGLTKEIPSYYDNKLEYLEDELYDKYYYNRDTKTIYEIVEDRELGDGDIMEASHNDDGTISFNIKFYNGGASLGECLDYAINKLNNTES